MSNRFHRTCRPAVESRASFCPLAPSRSRLSPTYRICISHGCAERSGWQTLTRGSACGASNAWRTASWPDRSSGVDQTMGLGWRRETGLARRGLRSAIRDGGRQPEPASPVRVGQRQPLPPPPTSTGGPAATFFLSPVIPQSQISQARQSSPV